MMQYGQLALGHKQNQVAPVKVDFFDKVAVHHIVASNKHCIACSKDGTHSVQYHFELIYTTGVLYTWGTFQYGRLGYNMHRYGKLSERGMSKGEQTTPLEVEALKGETVIQVGKHSILLFVFIPTEKVLRKT
jgi:alpha-tubulin suppressor-like RCC1 family protein